MIDPIRFGITPAMHRIDLRIFASLAALGALAACGGDGNPGHSEPSDAGSDSIALTAGTGASAGTATDTGGSANVDNGGAAPQAGSANALGGANTAGTNPGSAGTAAGGAAPTEYWIATDGADTNPGTEDKPFKTLPVAILKAKAGVTLWLKPGTYQYAVTVDIGARYVGTAALPIKLQAAPGARPVLDFSSQPRGMDALRGMNVNGDYWHIKGIELLKASDNCIAIAGSNNIIEDVIVHECGDTGIQITAPSSQATDQTRAANNMLLNCDSWGNLDSATGGENADGFAAKLRIGPGNVFKGCRAWNNADDGWDLFAADDVVKIDGCWAFSNGKPIGGSNPAGDGNGFKLGGAPNGVGQGGAVHLVTNSFGFENKACGFVRNNNPDVPKLTACGAKDNKTEYCSLSVAGEVTMSMTADEAIAAKRNADGSLPAMK